MCNVWKSCASLVIDGWGARNAFSRLPNREATFKSTGMSLFNPVMLWWSFAWLQVVCALSVERCQSYNLDESYNCSRVKKYLH